MLRNAVEAQQAFSLDVEHDFQVWLSFVCHTAEKLQTENQLPYIYSYPF